MTRFLFHFVAIGISTGFFFLFMKEHWKILLPIWLLILAHLGAVYLGQKMPQKEAERILAKKDKKN